MAPAGNQSATEKTNTSLNLDGKDGNGRVAKPPIEKEGRKVDRGR